MLANLMVGCSPASEALPAVTPSAISPIQTGATSSPKPPVATQTAASPTQTTEVVRESLACLPQGDPSPLPEGPFDIYPQAILQFLNEGGWIEELDEALYAAGIANMPVTVDAADLTGDGFEEVIVSIFDPESWEMPKAGMLLIFACDQHEYRLVYQDDSRPTDGVPGIRFLQDLNADGSFELVVSSGSCGAHTCFEKVQVIGWDGSQLTNRLDGKTDDLPHPTIYLELSEQDEIYDIYITGSGIASVGAGPQRNITRYWSYNEDTQIWQVSSLELGPSPYRIHVLHDAVAAAKDGDYQQALLLYNRVISDSTLEDWADPALEQAWTGAFARYQLVAIYTLQDRAAFAEVIFGEMEIAYPPDSPQHGYTAMAAAYLEGGADAGCVAAITFATAHPEILDPLGWQTFGYGNPLFSPEDVCP